LAKLNRKLCIAPMMDWTDRHDRYFLRQISRYVMLYTEMVTTGAVLHGQRERLLGFHKEEHPLAVQLGGSDPAELAESARICEAFGYDEVNLNVGCPSDRVQRGKIGACLMAEPELVAECVRAMQHAVNIPVTVKSRTGVDHLDSYEHLTRFVDTVASAGCRTFIIHARKAWLQGLSPKQNREIPPLQYERVYHIKQDFPELEIVINGGITSLEQAEQHLQHVDGVMIGREAYHNPYMLAEADRRIFGALNEPPSREMLVDIMTRYTELHLADGGRFNQVSRHLLGLFYGQPGGRLWRRFLSEKGNRADAKAELFIQALDYMKSSLSS
jgi:tRNA-dihydrouridine synthase A